MDYIFSWSVKNKGIVIQFFRLVYAVLLCICLLSIYAIATDNKLLIYFLNIALLSGKGAIIFFVLVSLPGIFRRLRIRAKIFNLLMLFRRQLGVTTFLLVFIHAIVMRLGPILLKGVPLQLMIFELFGFSAFFLLIFLWVTSNDWSVNTLGKWWGRIHALFYIILWFVFFHVMLQRVSIWSVLIGSIAFLEVISYIYHFFTKPRVSSPVNTPSPVAQP